MKDDQLLERIVLNQTVTAGKPVIRGTRLTVDYILSGNCGTSALINDEISSTRFQRHEICVLQSFSCKKETSTEVILREPIVFLKISFLG